MWKYNQTQESDELFHYGILGMRWGVRRTPAQLARISGRKKTKRDTDDNASDDYKKARSKSTKEMTDAELQSAIRRLQMEKQYKDLNPPTVSRGKKMTDFVLKKAGNMALDAGLQLGKDYAVKKAKDKLGLSDKKSDSDKEFDALKKAAAYEAQKKSYESNSGKKWTWDPEKK